MLTLQGSIPLPSRSVEDRILPRLKLGSVAPSFDFMKLRQTLIDGDKEQSIKLLKGLHEKFWHALKPTMARCLQRLGVPNQCYDLIDVVLRTCEHCLAFAPVPRKPKFGADLAGYFW